MADKKDCGKHGGVGGGGRFFRRRAYGSCCGCLLFLIIIVLFAILIVYLVLRPHKPRFYVQDATVRQWNTTDDLLTSSLQFTVLSRNPNNRIGIYYDQISAYATYIGQQVTPFYPLSPFYQGHKDVNVLSPVLYGSLVPLAPFIADHLKVDEQTGVLTLNLRMNGRIRWKVGTWTSAHYRLNVNCYTILGLSGSGFVGQAPLQPGTRCNVNV